MMSRWNHISGTLCQHNTCRKNIIAPNHMPMRPQTKNQTCHHINLFHNSYFICQVVCYTLPNKQNHARRGEACMFDLETSALIFHCLTIGPQSIRWVGSGGFWLWTEGGSHGSKWAWPSFPHPKTTTNFLFKPRFCTTTSEYNDNAGTEFEAELGTILEV